MVAACRRRCRWPPPFPSPPAPGAAERHDAPPPALPRFTAAAPPCRGAGGGCGTAVAAGAGRGGARHPAGPAAAAAA
ncbi:hypothetical protein E0493_05025 [Roseomonas sp. M0104]|uniref:Uncharacterized protein n=1 Tax=Teichococcus coralli TaxID=2545983 RepID=A0A845B9D7_9PROT|nr:hypothetical protein [Pseudoroseomonas coralli]